MTEVSQVTCIRCKASHPESLYSGGDRLCVYCKADIAEQQPLPAPVVTEKAADATLEEQARAELALRHLTRKRLLPFV